MAENPYSKLHNAINNHPGWVGDGGIFGGRSENYIGAQLFADYVQEKRRENKDNLPAPTAENHLCRDFLGYVKEREEKDGTSYGETQERIQRMLNNGSMTDRDLVDFAEIFDDLKIGKKKGETVTDYVNALNAAPTSAPKTGEASTPVEDIQGSTGNALRKATGAPAIAGAPTPTGTPATSAPIPTGAPTGTPATTTSAPVPQEAPQDIPSETPRPEEGYPATEEEAKLPEGKEIPEEEPGKKLEGTEKPTPTTTKRTETPTYRLSPLVGTTIPMKKVEKKGEKPGGKSHGKKPLIPKAGKFITPEPGYRRKVKPKTVTKQTEQQRTVEEQRGRRRPEASPELTTATATRPVAPTRSGGGVMARRAVQIAAGGVGGGWFIFGAGDGEAAVAATVLTMIHFLF